MSKLNFSNCKVMHTLTFIVSSKLWLSYGCDFSDTGVPMVLKTTEIVSLAWEMALTSNLQLERGAGLGGVT